MPFNDGIAEWCIGHLTDEDMVAFLKRCKDGLKRRGRIIVKENTSQHHFVVDREDSSVTRSHEYLRDMFGDAGLALVHSARQTNFPQQLHTVRMYELQVPNI
jgi:protein N-terminal methyltransferase